MFCLFNARASLPMHLPVPPLNIQTVNICLSWQPDRKSISPLCQPPHSQQMKVHKSFCVAAESAVMLVNGCDLAWFYFCLAHLWPLSSSLVGFFGSFRQNVNIGCPAAVYFHITLSTSSGSTCVLHCNFCVLASYYHWCFPSTDV